MEPDDNYEYKDKTADSVTNLTDQSTQGVTKVQAQWKMGREQ